MKYHASQQCLSRKQEKGQPEKQLNVPSSCHCAFVVCSICNSLKEGRCPYWATCSIAGSRVQTVLFCHFDYRSRLLKHNIQKFKWRRVCKGSKAVEHFSMSTSVAFPEIGNHRVGEDLLGAPIALVSYNFMYFPCSLSFFFSFQSSSLSCFWVLSVFFGGDPEFQRSQRVRFSAVGTENCSKLVLGDRLNCNGRVRYCSRRLVIISAPGFTGICFVSSQGCQSWETTFKIQQIFGEQCIKIIASNMKP